MARHIPLSVAITLETGYTYKFYRLRTFKNPLVLYSQVRARFFDK